METENINNTTQEYTTVRIDKETLQFLNIIKADLLKQNPNRKKITFNEIIKQKIQ